MSNTAESNARRMWDARVARQPYANLPDPAAPLSIAQAYEAQEAYWRLAEPVYGPVAGVKVATTTKVMQQLMGITHPCGGAIFAKTIHSSPARISKAAFVNLRVECEIALKLGKDMAAARAPWTAETAAACVAGAMPAFELIEDRNAVYTQTRATSMIVDNCWNGGVVLGPMKKVAPGDVIGVKGRQTFRRRKRREPVRDAGVACQPDGGAPSRFEKRHGRHHGESRPDVLDLAG